VETPFDPALQRRGTSRSNQRTGMIDREIQRCGQFNELLTPVLECVVAFRGVRLNVKGVFAEGYRRVQFRRGPTPRSGIDCCELVDNQPARPPSHDDGRPKTT
jgi:hypothetical protein